jgi:HD superfamily phosphohydrolase
MNQKVYIICDPVHGMMKFTKAQHNIISNIIDTPSFQRLRHIKQLSFAEFAFPGAVHTRFNHCIGAAYLSTKVSYALEIEDPELVMISSLLHDIGHGPLSHAFEHIYDDNLKIKHERWTEKFITEIISQNTDSKLIEKLEKSIKIINKTSAEYKLEQKIVSSQMDVDRFDYLLRDSHFCGVSYGVFDVDWLISCMEKNAEVDNIVISSKGIRCLEHYLMARKLMTQNVCFHIRSYFVKFFQS